MTYPEGACRILSMMLSRWWSLSAAARISHAPRCPTSTTAWRYAARQVGLLQPRAWPGLGELASWGAIAPALRSKLQAIPTPTVRELASFDDWHRRPCGVGYGTRGGTSRGAGAGSRYLKVICQHPGCGYQVRLTRKWLALGAPRCPLIGHGDLVLEAAARALDDGVGA